MISDEKARIESIVRPLVAGAPQPLPLLDSGAVRLLAGAADGDDCAVFEVTGQLELVVTTDYVRGTKFRLYELGHLSLFDLGYYLAVANLSDVASMGASPIGVLPVIRYPRDLDDAAFSECLQGIIAGAADHGANCVGGDIGTAERLILSASAIGVCNAGRTLRRSGASAGDSVFVSGPIGRAGAGLLYFSALSAGQILPISETGESDLLTSWRRPRARFDIAKALGTVGTATACQDVSDGLKATLEELASASAVRLEIDPGALPVPSSVYEVAEVFDVDPIALALSASVDFELLFCASPLTDQESLSRLSELGVQRIGRCYEGAGAQLSTDDGLQSLPGVEWRHQSDQIELTILDGLRG